MNDKAVTHGRFPTTTDLAEVRCGLCGACYDTPSAKARHLGQDHGASVVVRRFDGVDEYEWATRRDATRAGTTTRDDSSTGGK